jgi:AbiV family abortive infection protein
MRMAILKTNQDERELLRAGTLAAIGNAAELLDDAQLLLEHGRYGRAVSLSIIGNEELAKAMLYVLAALDAVPGLRKRLPHRGPITDHKAKQVTIEFAGIAAWLVDEYQSIRHDEAGGMGIFDPVVWLCEFLAHSEDWVRQEVEWLDRRDARKLGPDEKKSPSQRYQEGIKKMLSDNAIGKLAGPNPTPEEQKWAGLYVDVDGAVSTPNTITERKARLAVVELEANLGTVERLQDALEDDALWDELCERYPCR